VCLEQLNLISLYAAFHRLHRCFHLANFNNLHLVAPPELKPKMWKRYVDDILEVVKKGSTEKLTNLLNSLDTTGSIEFTYEEQQDGSLKLCIYRKSTHTDQYLNFSSHHPAEHKLSVVRTLLERSQNLVTDSQDKTQEDAHVEEAVRACGYPSWSFAKVRRQIESKGQRREIRRRRSW